MHNEILHKNIGSRTPFKRLTASSYHKYSQSLEAMNGIRKLFVQNR